MSYIPRKPLSIRTARATWLAAWTATSAALALPGAAIASSEAWHAHAESVLELLQADTRRALAGMPGASGPAAPAARSPVQPPKAPDRIELTALYGTDGKFTAVVHVNGVRKEYRPGATLPYAGNGAAREYRLVRIVDSCVLLKKQNQSRTRSACFNPTLQLDAVPVRQGNPAMAGAASSLNAPLPDVMRAKGAQ